MAFGLVTSQNITAPKQLFRNKLFNCCLVTSQNITAPKLHLAGILPLSSLVTSQNITAPKHYESLIVVVRV